MARPHPSRGAATDQHSPRKEEGDHGPGWRIARTGSPALTVRTACYTRLSRLCRSIDHKRHVMCHSFRPHGARNVGTKMRLRPLWGRLLLALLLVLAIMMPVRSALAVHDLQGGLELQGSVFGDAAGTALSQVDWANKSGFPGLFN